MPYHRFRATYRARPRIRELPEKVASLKMEQIEVKSYIEGLVKSFERKAALDSNYHGARGREAMDFARTGDRSDCPSIPYSLAKQSA